MAMNALYFGALLNEKPALLKRMIAFNALLRRADPGAEDGSEALPAALHAALMRYPSAEAAWRRQRAAERSEPQAAERGVWDFTDESARLVFLPAEALADLLAKSAASVLGSEISAALTKAERSAIRRTLGDAAVDFALARGRFQAGPLGVALREKLPLGTLEVRAQTAAALLYKTLEADWPEKVRAAGRGLAEASPRLSMLIGASGRQDEAPEPRHEALPDGAGETAERALRRRTWQFIKKIIIRELDPAWLPFFN